MENKPDKPNILATYPNMPLCLENEDGSRARLDQASLLSSMIFGDTKYRYETRNYLYKNRVRISITSECNCHCLHCFEGDEDGKMYGTFSLDEIGRILDECLMVGIRQVELTGGEPLMHPEFNEILRLIRSRDMLLYAIYTNGLLINEELLDLLHELHLRPIFSISFDGLNTHDAFRGVPGMEKTIIRNMELVKESGFKLCCNIQVNRLTLSTVTDTARYLATNFDSTLFLIKTSPSLRWEKACPGGTLTYGEFFDACFEVVKADIQEKWGVDLRMLHLPTVPSDLNMQHVFKTWHSDIKCPMSSLLISHCTKANHTLIIVHDGRVLPCEAFSGYSLKKGFLTGDDVNILKRPLKEILTDSEYRKIYDVTLNDLAAAEPKCRDCRWLSICKGGCRLLSLDGLDDITFDRKSKPNCTFFKGGYAEKFEALFNEIDTRDGP